MNTLGTNFRLYNKRLPLLLLLILVLLLAACTGPGDDPTEGPADPDDPLVEQPSEEVDVTEEDADVTEEDAAPEASAPGSAFNGVLNVAMQPVVNLDPIAISSDSEVLVANHIYDYLVDVDANNQIVPRLASNIQRGEGGLTYTFDLVQNATFHDGSPLTPQDVVWTFERLRDTEGTPTADLYANIDTIEASGENQVTFTLNEPNPFFLFDLSDNHALILKEGTEDPGTEFNGTGPFRVANYSPEDRIELVANENYWLDGQPRLAGVNVIFFNDDAAAVDALRGGQIDLVMRMPTALFQTLQEEPGIVTIDVPTNGFDLVRLRADRAPGDDPRVIEALKRATDRDAIFNVVQQGYGAMGADHPVGPMYTDYHDPAVEPLERDVEAARALLAEAGYDEDNPLQMTLHTPDTGGRPDLAAVLKEQWAEAGVDIEISVEPESVYYGEDGWLEVDLGITGWGSRPYPQFYFDTMLTCGARWNEAHYCNETLDDLAEVAGTTLDDSERVRAYQAAQELLANEGPVIIPYFFATFGAIDENFENFELKPFAGRTDFREVIFTGSE